MDVRPSDIAALAVKVKKRNYLRYLVEIKLVNVRAFRGQKISFDFPVTAVIGTNGGGKSTILGAAALAYKSARPGDFFPKSNVGDSSMADWRIEYELLDQGEKKGQSIDRNARFVSAKWRRENLLDRDLVVVPIQRTVPASEQSRFRKFIGMIQQSDPVVEELSSVVKSAAGRILGKSLDGYKTAKLKNGDSDYILLGMQKSNDYSQFHFGAGEASVIEMVTKIEKASDASLILIEEIENGLHPLATEKMTEYLIDVAQRKNSQVIFTTHSEYALKILPSEAIWACVDGQAYQGKLSIESLRAIKGSVDREIAIFVEDEFARDLVLEAIRQMDSKILAFAEVHAAGGFPFVVEVARHHNSNPAISTKAIAVADGDASLEEDPEEFILKLPGQIPENEVFGFLVQRIEELSALLRQRCQCPQVSQDDLVKAFKAVELDTTDPHLYFAKLGERLGFLSELIVRRGCISVYVEHKRAEFAGIIGFINKLSSV